MEPREFVENALTSIVQGIQSAQGAEGCGGLIAPAKIGSHEFPKKSGVVHAATIVSTVAKFDVAVTASSTKSGSIDGKIKILVVEAELDGRLERKSEMISRIQFSVPVLMPENPRAWHEEKS
jgi:hypothetical protein